MTLEDFVRVEWKPNAELALKKKSVSFYESQLDRRKLPPLFSIAATDWLKTRTGIAPSTERSYKLAISQLARDFGKQLLYGF